jgi:tricorn protease
MAPSLLSRALRAGLVVAGLGAAASASAETKLLRFPDVHGERVTFVYAGDIYIASTAGGVAQRLTSHAGSELYPKFSPDGSQIAFSAEYNGTRQVYVMPAGGGEPRQLTWYNDVGPMPPRGGTDNRVLDWTPDGQNVLVRMNRVATDERGGRPYLVPVDGGMETPLAIPETGGGMLSPDGTQFVYTPIDRDFRSWKRYRGGRAQDVWTYDLVNNTSQQLTDHPATDHQPMWVGDQVYFVSDRNYTLNLFGMPAAGGEPRQLTEFSEFDVLWPSAGPDSIVFENGGALWQFVPASGQTRQIPITVRGDLPQTLPRFVDASKNIESFDLSPDGKRALFGARGEVFSVPAKHGETRNLSRTPDAREHSVSWSPDGRSVAYLSDASGEYELYVQAQDGSSAARRVSTDGDIWRFQPLWSPDSRHFVYADKRQRLRLVNAESGVTAELDNSVQEDITQYSWSPDSRFVAYVKTGASRNGSIWLYSVDSAAAQQLTPDETSEFAPTFDPEGRYLYFLSNRDFNLGFSAFEFNYLYQNATRIYAAPLAADGPVLYAPKSDEVSATPAAEAKPAAAVTAPKRLRIDVPGFNQRVVALKAPAGNYQGLSANAKGVFFVANNGQGPGELRYLGLDDEQPKTVANQITGYRLASGGGHLLLRRSERFAITEAKPEVDFDAGVLKLDGLQLRVDPKREWAQQYADAWRILRDWFYDPGMHGQDWVAIRDRYAALLPHVASRADLDYLLTELAGEVNAGHVYVERGDEPQVERRAGGLLGAEFSRHDSGYFKVGKVFAGENWNPALRSPLTEAHANVSEGDYILAIDNVSTREVANFYQLLEGKGERTVSLRVNNRPEEAGAREVRVQTITSEQGLRYKAWVDGRRRLAAELSDGRVGYIHMPNTAVEGNRELNRGMLAYGHMDALILDDRYNGGGFIPDRMIELLTRQPLNYWKRRGLEPNPTPFLHHAGPKAMLTNGLSSSGGDALPYYFRKMGLGPIIGTRTWGGLIGISGNPRLADGGAILAATFRFMDTNGQWAVEDEGVAPDIQVIDRPELIAAGRDPSLERAVAELLQALQAKPTHQPVAPPAPSRFPRL